MKANIPSGLPRTPEGVKPGERVVTRAWKYDGSPHWVTHGTALGADEYGEWIHQPRGIFVARPGVAFQASEDAVVLVPHQGEWIATFHTGNDRRGLKIYIDLSTQIGWSPLRPAGWEVHSVDMDLDVVCRSTTGLYVDDEDEFQEHTVTMGYPQELVEAITAEAQSLLGRVRNHEPPFDGRSEGRFAQGRSLL